MSVDASDDTVEAGSSVLAQLKEKPTQEDIDYAAQLNERAITNNNNNNNHPDAETTSAAVSPAPVACIMSSRLEVYAWWLYDWANSPQYNILLGLVWPLFVFVLATEYACENNTPHQCDVEYAPIKSNIALQISMGAWKLKPSSFAFTVISLSGLLQAFVYVMFGALADYANYRYFGFRACTLIACSLNLVFFFCWDSSTYMFVGWLGAIQLVFFGLALIYYNSMLPDIIENHWLTLRAMRSNKSADAIANLKQTLTDDISQFGYMLGYCGSLFLTIVTVAIFAAMAPTISAKRRKYGLQSSSDSKIQKYEEQWLKPVHQIAIKYTPTYITSIQLFYHQLDIDGDVYPSESLQNTYTVMNETAAVYSIPSNTDYIAEIQLWYNSNDKSIGSLQFVSQNGVRSALYGNQTVDRADQSSSTVVGDSKVGDFILAGYTVYTANKLVNGNADIAVVSGMDVLLLNQKTGQWPSTLDYRIIFVLVFAWWFGFQIFTFKYIKRRDKAPIAKGSSFWTASPKEFYHALRQARKFPHMFRYLISWFLFSDGLNTLQTTAVLFAREDLFMSQTELAFLVLELLLVSSVGGLMFLKIQRRTKWNAKQMLLLHLAFMNTLSVYVMFGLIPGCPFGLCSKLELYLYVIVWGLNVGAMQSYARSCFAALIPIGMESQMFSLFEITDKGSSWMGPLLVALIGNATSIRWGLFYVVLFFAIPVPLLVFGVNMKEGMLQAGRHEDEEQELQRKNSNIGTTVDKNSEKASIIPVDGSDTDNAHFNHNDNDNDNDNNVEMTDAA